VNPVAHDDTCEHKVDGRRKENWSNCQAEDIAVKGAFSIYTLRNTGGWKAYTRKRLLLKG
jgi:hypothetical protein